ncbi:excisionase family DNA binding protein [Spirosoma lacussanchae]
MIALDAQFARDLQATLDANRQLMATVQERLKQDVPLNIKEAAAWLKVARSTLMTYIERGEIVPSEYGNRLWVMRSELERFLERHRRQ